jgi:hypothetical protein
MKYNSVFIASFHSTTAAIWLVYMWMGVKKSFYALEYARTNSITLVQRHFMHWIIQELTPLPWYSDILCIGVCKN